MNRRRAASAPKPQDGRAPAEGQPKPEHVTDHLANERTFLAWIRSAVGIIALGFVVSKFALYLRVLARDTNSKTPSSGHSEIVGLVLVGIGVAMVITALVRYLRNQQLISEGSYRPSRWIDIILALLITAGGVAMFVLLLATA